MDYRRVLVELEAGMKATREAWEPGRYVVKEDGWVVVHFRSGSGAEWVPSPEDEAADDWLIASPDGIIRWADGTVA
jgi:hypothetical protein